jgi:Holliday junction resolvase RusA-like endonuclease
VTIVTYLIVINNEILEKYKQYYFDKYPRRRVFPIKKPVHPSINVWSRLRRPEMNKLKQDWGEFSEFLVDYYGLRDICITKCNMTIKSYMPTKRRFDAENLTPKFILDGLVHAGLLLDDCITVIKSITLTGDYDKLNSRTEILIETIK